MTSSKSTDGGIFQVFECAEGEFEYVQDVPGKIRYEFRLKNKNFCIFR